MEFIEKGLSLLGVLWSLIRIPWVLLGHVPFIGGGLQTLVTSTLTLMVMWYVWKFLPSGLSAYLGRGAGKVFRWVGSKIGGTFGALLQGSRVVYKDRIVYRLPFKKGLALRARWSFIGGATVFGAMHHEKIASAVAWVRATVGV